MDWVRNSYVELAYDTALFTTDEEGELIDIKNDRGLKLKYSKLVEEGKAQSKLKKIKVNVDVASFWIPLGSVQLKNKEPGLCRLELYMIGREWNEVSVDVSKKGNQQCTSKMGSNVSRS